MAEPIKNRKISLREILEEMAEDEAFSEEDRRKSHEKLLELEHKEWNNNQPHPERNL